MSYAHSKHWEDADFGQEYKRVRRKRPCECAECLKDKSHFYPRGTI